MNNDHFLNINPCRLIHCLSGILSNTEIDKIKKALNANVKKLVNLGQAHLRFAKKMDGNTSWRQRVSRSYYSAYCTSRAVRLAITGHYSKDSSDHMKIGNLPNDFPDKTIWEEFLMKFRGDRNLADYDHTALESALEISSDEYVVKANEFYRTARKYLVNKGAL